MHRKPGWLGARGEGGIQSKEQDAAASFPLCSRRVLLLEMSHSAMGGCWPHLARPAHVLMALDRAALPGLPYTCGCLSIKKIPCLLHVKTLLSKLSLSWRQAATLCHLAVNHITNNNKPVAVPRNPRSVSVCPH